MANVATATRSSAGFEATKLRAAAIACASGAPRIDCERSIARTTDFSAPRFSVRSIRTASPFSRSFGACELGSDVRTVTRMTGYSPVSTLRTETPALAAGTRGQSPLQERLR